MTQSDTTRNSVTFFRRKFCVYNNGAGNSPRWTVSFLPLSPVNCSCHLRNQSFCLGRGMYMYILPPSMDEVLSEERQLMKWVELFQVGTFWVAIFRGRFSKGEFDGWEFSWWEFYRGEFSYNRWKQCCRFVRNKSMDDRLLGFLKQAGSLLRVLKLLVLQKSFKQFSLTSVFKSPMIRILSSIFRYTSRPLFRGCRWLEMLLLCGL